MHKRFIWIIEVERVRKYDKPNYRNNVREYCFMKINIFDGNHKTQDSKNKNMLQHQFLMQKSEH